MPDIVVNIRMPGFGGVNLNRREFLKCAGVMSAVALVGKTFIGPETITFVEYEIDEDIMRESMTLGKTREVDGKLVMDVSLDQERALDAVTLIDSNGKRWAYRDAMELAG